MLLQVEFVFKNYVYLIKVVCVQFGGLWGVPPWCVYIYIDVIYQTHICDAGDQRQEVQ